MIEKRLIEANALEADCNIFNAWDAQIVKAWLDDQPTVDAVEVVRCKDCKHRYTASTGLIFCRQHITASAKDDDFCSYGEKRREGE